MHRISFYYPDGSTRTVWVETWFRNGMHIETQDKDGKRVLYGFLPHMIEMNVPYGER